MKAALRVECFENASLPLLCGQVKTEVFEYDDFIHRSTQGMLSYLHRSSVFARMGENNSNALRVDAFFKKNRFLNYPVTCGRGLYIK